MAERREYDVLKDQVDIQEREREYWMSGKEREEQEVYEISNLSITFFTWNFQAENNIEDKAKRWVDPI